jgi:predicted 3-demethylubiquinone-9 3-methyltransferase (glyoxalase superfamily)
MTVEFELDRQPFTALNGGPQFHFNEAISLQISCRDQREVDHYWEALTAGGDDRAQACAGSRIGSAFPGRSCRRRSCR